MNTLNEILASGLSKTKKVIKLSGLGYSINEIAELIGSGYGFVWVVLKKRHPQGIVNVGFIPTEFQRKFGVEIEAFGIERDVLARKLRAAGIGVAVASRVATSGTAWKVTTDGSIRGEKGFEVVSPILEGASGLAQLEIVCRVLKENNAKINKTCGLHIHFDANGFGIKQWRNLYINYLTFETEIDSFMPTSRRADNNTYCKGMEGSRGKEGMIEAIKGCTSVRDIKALYGSRYYKINCESFFKHGTVEFRQHSGTIEYSKIMNWVRFLHNLVSYSERSQAPDGDFTKMAEFNQNEIIAYLDERRQELN